MMPSTLPGHDGPVTQPPQPVLRHRTSSSLSDFTLYEIHQDEIIEQDPEKDNVIHSGGLVVVAEADKLKDQLNESIEEFDFEDDGTFKCTNWAGRRFYSDYIKAGIDYKRQKDPDYLPQRDVVMLFESPSSSATDSSFHNASKYRFHDWPPPKSSRSKGILGPCRYASMTGTSFPIFLRDGAPPDGLMDHWAHSLPHFQPPTFVNKIDTDLNTVYAYLPVEQLKHHVNDPDTHFHLAGKDAIHLMTQKTTQLLPDTRTKRPCVVKTTHSMGSKGIFIITDDEDEEEFHKFLLEAGNPTYVVVDFVDISRNVACHFFMHPNGSIVWFGSNENHREPDGKFSSDSYLILENQDSLKEMQLPFVEEVVRYCRAMNFWGFCGIDVLFDSTGNGYLVDINPRVTGSCPALMTLTQLKNEYGFQVGLFRRSGAINYFGPASQLLDEVKTYNEEHKGKSCVIIHSLCQNETTGNTRINIGVYGTSLGECKAVLNTFAKPARRKKAAAVAAAAASPTPAEPVPLLPTAVAPAAAVVVVSPPLPEPETAAPAAPPSPTVGLEVLPEE